MNPIRLRRFDATLSVCRLSPDEPLAAWMQQGPLWSVSRTPDELSVVCSSEYAPAGIRQEGPFAVFAVEGPLAFSLTGILSRLSVPLAEAGIPLFVISTFDTDYVLVSEERAVDAIRCWQAAGMEGVA